MSKKFTKKKQKEIFEKFKIFVNNFFPNTEFTLNDNFAQEKIFVTHKVFVNTIYGKMSIIFDSGDNMLTCFRKFENEPKGLLWNYNKYTYKFNLHSFSEDEFFHILDMQFSHLSGKYDEKFLENGVDFIE